MKSNIENTQLLERSPISQLFLKYALPSLVTVLFFGLQNIVDGIVVGNYAGAEALGGVNIVLPFYSMLMVVAFIIGTGCQTIVSHGLGENNLQKSQDAMTTGFWALTLVSITITAILLFFAEQFTKLLGADEVLIPHALGYLKGLLPFILPIALCFYSDAMLKALGHPKFSMLMMSFTVILNIAFSVYLVKYAGMGTMGASMATGIAFSIGLLISAIITFNPKQKLSMLKGRFSGKLLWQSFYNGSSEGVSEMASAVTIFVVNLAVIKLMGTEGISAFTVINYINFTGVLIFLGISDGLIPVLGYNYGAGNFERVKNIFRYAAKINISIGIAIFFVLQFFGSSIIQLFFDDADSKVLNIATLGLSIYSFVFLINGMNILITSYFTSLGEAGKSILMAVCRGIVFIVTGVSILPLFFGINGAWITIPLAELLTLFLAVYLLIKTNKKFIL
ncbi:MATE family efflux transporter [Neisseria iguanae]|uniref:Multidrug export protein MepA n=1 Tax=Neisseria iguanae TaxID=90242 RepID=A0A2P7U143_9NEIS|nr:MATE family efflux transporter [Neisseria iguanae]PSJ80702.1 multidrug transporter MatE [Neisseria iguanae]